MPRRLFKGSEKMTRNGIEYNLFDSPYYLTIGEVKYYFSSDLHRRKFENQYVKNRKTFTEKIACMTNLNVSCETFCDISLYRKIESRGFLIEKDGEKICYNRVMELIADYRK